VGAAISKCRGLMVRGLLLALAISPAARAQEVDGVLPVLAPIAPASGSPAYIPLTPHERWHGFLHETLLGTRPAVQIFGTAFFEHLSREPVQWGLGVHGYAHRVENRIYSTAIDGSVHASLAAALHHDTRYLSTHDGSAIERVRRALMRTFVTSNQSGGRAFDIAGLGGIYAGAMLPMYWHPRRYSPTAQGVRAGNFGVMFQAGSNLFKEFQPDIKKLLARKGTEAGSPSAAGSR
jgi:hypothetical protein